MEMNGGENLSSHSVGGNVKEIHNMNDLQAYYRKNIKGIPGINTISESPLIQQQQFSNYSQNLAYNGRSKRPSIGGSSINTQNSKPAVSIPSQSYTASISPILKSPSSIKSAVTPTYQSQAQRNSPSMSYNNGGDRNRRLSEAHYEIDELSAAIKILNTSSDSSKSGNPKIISVPPNTTGQPVTKVIYNRSPSLCESQIYSKSSPYNLYASPQQKSSKTPTLDFPMYVSNNNELDGIPPLPPSVNGQEYINEYFDPLVDTPPRTASVGVLREIIPNPYIKKNTR